MSFNEDIDSISTIIHEGGHNVHHQYVTENNPIQYREISVRVAEVASLTNECLLSHYFLEHGKTKEEKLNGLENILRVFAANFYGAIREGKMLIEFQRAYRQLDIIRIGSSNRNFEGECH